MKTRPLVIDDSVRDRAKAIMAYAKDRPFTMDSLRAIMSGKAPPPGDSPEFVMDVQYGFRCVFTYEQQPQIGLCAHLSVSVHPREEGQYPNHVAVTMIARDLFEMPGLELEKNPPVIPPNYRVWIEDPYLAVNVLRIITSGN